MSPLRPSHSWAQQRFSRSSGRVDREAALGVTATSEPGAQAARLLLAHPQGHAVVTPHCTKTEMRRITKQLEMAGRRLCRLPHPCTQGGSWPAQPQERGAFHTAFLPFFCCFYLEVSLFLGALDGSLVCLLLCVDSVNKALVATSYPGPAFFSTC